MRTPRAPWLLLCAALQLGWPGRLLGAPCGPCSPVFLPARLSVPEGGNASFSCRLPRAARNLKLNWYRLGPGDQSTKVAAFPAEPRGGGRDGRFSVAPEPGQNGTFRMHLAGARPSDSGAYMCGAIYLPGGTQPAAGPGIESPSIAESPSIQLTVTARAPKLPTEPPRPSPGPAGALQSLVVSVTGVLAAVLLLLLLLAWGLASARPGGLPGACAGRSQDTPAKEEGPAAAPVFTVDYGELDFEPRARTPEPPDACVPAQTEYATIVFPAGPAPPGRRASAESRPAPRAPRPEDGHCSWPL